MAINTTLEKAKHKTSSELRDLRRKFRDRSLHIPLSSPQHPAHALLSPSLDEDDEDEEDVDIDHLLKEDLIFAEMAKTLESLIRKGKEACEFQVPREEIFKSKVLINHDGLPNGFQSRLRRLSSPLNSSNDVSLDTSITQIGISTCGSFSDQTGIDSSPETVIKPSRPSLNIHSLSLQDADEGHQELKRPTGLAVARSLSFWGSNDV